MSQAVTYVHWNDGLQYTIKKLCDIKFNPYILHINEQVIRSVIIRFSKLISAQNFNYMACVFKAKTVFRSEKPINVKQTDKKNRYVSLKGLAFQFIIAFCNIEMD